MVVHGTTRHSKHEMPTDKTCEMWQCIEFAINIVIAR